MRRNSFFQAVFLSGLIVALYCACETATNTNTVANADRVNTNATVSNTNVAVNNTGTAANAGLSNANKIANANMISKNANSVKAKPTPAQTPNSNNQSSNNERKDEGLFSFPPPKVISFAVIPKELLLNRDRETTLNDVSQKLAKGLDDAGFSDGKYTYFWNNNEEFAIVTQIERINAEGEPLLDERWDNSPSLPTARNIGEYGRFLINGKKVFYRVYAFIVSRKTYNNFKRNSSPSFEMAREWMNKGETQLGGDEGAAVQEVIFSDNHRCYALLYLFVNHTSLDYPKSVDKLEEGEIHLKSSLNTAVKDHLARTQINFGD